MGRWQQSTSEEGGKRDGAWTTKRGQGQGQAGFVERACRRAGRDLTAVLLLPLCALLSPPALQGPAVERLLHTLPVHVATIHMLQVGCGAVPSSGRWPPPPAPRIAAAAGSQHVASADLRVW